MRVCDGDCFADFIYALIMAVFLGVLYDFIRCLGIKKRRISDFLFSVSAFVFFVYGWVFVLGGCIRWYVIITVISGLFLYFLTVSRLICIVLSFFSEKISKIFQFILKKLLTVAYFLGKIVLCISRSIFKCKYRRRGKNEKAKI